MNIVKFGETFNITETKETYKISGDLIKTVQGDIIINVSTADLEGNFIATMSGDYLVSENVFNFNFRTSIDKKYEQLEIIKLITDAIETILNDEV